MGLIRVAIVLTAVPALLLATWQVSRLGMADFLSRQESIADRKRAERMFPGSADFAVRAADLLRRKGKPMRAHLLKAVEVSPEDPGIWFDLGIASEREANPAAEKELLTAARLDTEYSPRWELAKYYYGQGNGIECDRWLAEALKIGTSDATPAFRMALRQGWTTDRVLALLPDRERMLTYLNWLITAREFPAAQEVAQRLVRQYPQGSKDSILILCDQLAAGSPEEVESSVALWNVLATAGLIPQALIYPAGDVRIVNGAFTTGEGERGFDWKRYPVEGLTADFSRYGFQMIFFGDEPEQFGIVRQLLSVKPGEKYRIRYSYQSTGVPAGSGLAWHVFDARKRTELTDDAVYLDDAHTGQSTSFQAPEGCRFVDLILIYQRQTGTSRIDASVTIKNIQVQAE